MMNNRTMTGPRRIDSRWPQTILIDRRRAPRQRNRQHHDRQQREPINWGLVLMVAGAGFLALASLLYKLTGPAL